MHNVRPVAAVALGAIVCVGGCAPIPYPALTSTEQRPTPLPAPIGADKSIAFVTSPYQSLSATEAECVIRELKALHRPLRVADSEVLRGKWRGLWPAGADPMPNMDEVLADTEVQHAIADNQIAYAVQLIRVGDVGCDFNLIIAAGGHMKKNITAHILDLESRQFLGDMVVNSSGELLGIGLSGCSTETGPWHYFGPLFLPIDYSCDRMAEELHRYFTSGQ